MPVFVALQQALRVVTDETRRYHQLHPGLPDAESVGAMGSGGGWPNLSSGGILHCPGMRQTASAFAPVVKKGSSTATAKWMI